MKREYTLCLRCKKPLVACEEVHAVKGSLYCSRECAVLDIMDDYILNAKELAVEAYDSEAEVVQTTDILSDELESAVACGLVKKEDNSTRNKEE